MDPGGTVPGPWIDVLQRPRWPSRRQSPGPNGTFKFQMCFNVPGDTFNRLGFCRSIRINLNRYKSLFMSLVYLLLEFLRAYQTPCNGH